MTQKATTMPAYPNRLIPQQDYHKISSGISEFLLQRSTPNKENTDSDGVPKPDQLASPTIRFQNYSLNLIGVFKPEDCYWKVSNEYNKFWNYKEVCQVPSPRFCEYDESKGALYFKVKDLNRKAIPFNRDNGDFFAMCCTEHTPTKSNYWHFQLDWVDENGTLIDLKKNKGWRKKLLTLIRTLLTINAQIEEPQTSFIPLSVYSSKSE